MLWMVGGFSAHLIHVDCNDDGGGGDEEVLTLFGLMHLFLPSFFSVGLPFSASDCWVERNSEHPNGEGELEECLLTGLCIKCITLDTFFVVILFVIKSLNIIYW